MNRQFLVSSPQFTANSTIFEITKGTPGLMTRVPTFTDRKLNLNVSLNKLSGTLPFSLDVTWIILEIAIQTAVKNGDFEMVNRLVFSSKTFSMHFYVKYIDVFRGESYRVLWSRMSQLFESLAHAVELFKHQPTYDGSPYMPVLTLIGSSVLNDWHPFVPWPFATPCLRVKNRGIVISEGVELEIYDVQTGDLHLDEVWMVGEEGKNALFKAEFFKTPNVVFSVVEQIRPWDIVVGDSKAIKVWLRFLKAFLGPASGIYLGTNGISGFICNEYIS